MLEYLKKRSQQEKAEEQQQQQQDAATAATEEGRKAIPTLPNRSYDTGGVIKRKEVPVLDRDEQAFLERLALTWEDPKAADGTVDASDDETDAQDNRPALPPRVKTPDLTWDSDSESFVREGAGKRSLSASGKEKPGTAKSGGAGVKEAGSRVGRRLTTLFARKPKAGGSPGGSSSSEAHPAHLAVPGQTDRADVANREEADRERDDLAQVLEDLDLDLAVRTVDDEKEEEAEEDAGKDGKGKAKGNTKADNNKKASRFSAVSLSADSAVLVRRFVVVLKDLVHGVPTAADDLRGLLDDRDGTIARTYERLPKSLRKLVSQLPTKLTSSLGPELLAAAAAEAAAVGGATAAAEAEAGAGAAAGFSLSMLLPMLTKPATLVKMLKGIMNALKLRWPAFIGTSAIWSVALFLLLFVLWYCHKRGRETRLEKEVAAAATAAADVAAIEGSAGAVPTIRATTPDGDVTIPSSTAASDMPRPPIGEYAPVQVKTS